MAREFHGWRAWVGRGLCGGRGSSERESDVQTVPVRGMHAQVRDLHWHHARAGLAVDEGVQGGASGDRIRTMREGREVEEDRGPR